MSSLDKFFRNKLKERSFPEDDLAWQEMETLLEDKEDRRRGLGWLFFLLGGIMIGTTLFINAPTNNGNNLREPISSADDFSNTKNIGKETLSENRIVDANENIAKEELKTNAVQKELNTNQESNIKLKNQNNILSNNNSQNTSAENQSMIANPKRDKVQGEIKTSDSQKIMTTTDVIQKGLPDILINSPADKDVKFETLTVENVADQKMNIAGAEKDTEENLETKPESGSDVSSESATAKKTIVLDFLHNPFLPLDKLEREEPNFSKGITKSPRFAAMKLGLRLEQSFIFPLADNREALILAAGPTFSYPIGKVWSLDAGLHYKYVSAEFNRADTINNMQYSFGLKEYETSSAVSSLHYAGASILINRTIRYFKVSLGIEVDRLLNVYGDLQQTQSLYPWELTGPDEATATVTATGRLENFTETKLLLSPMAKISYDLRSRARLSLGLKYQINPYVENSSAAATPFNQSETLQLQAGFTYYIFNWKKSLK